MFPAPMMPILMYPPCRYLEATVAPPTEFRRSSRTGRCVDLCRAEAVMLENVTPTPMLAVKDVTRARRFYEDTLGLEPLPTGVPDVIRYRAGGGIFVVYASQYAGTNQATAFNWT